MPTNAAIEVFFFLAFFNKKIKPFKKNILINKIFLKLSKNSRLNKLRNLNQMECLMKQL